MNFRILIKLTFTTAFDRIICIDLCVVLSDIFIHIAGGGAMRKLILIIVAIATISVVMSGCASSGKHVKKTIDNVHYYLLFGDEYSYWDW